MQWVDCKVLKAFPSINFPEIEGYGNFVISVIPNGWDKGATGNVVLYLDFLRFPWLVNISEFNGKLR